MVEQPAEPLADCSNREEVEMRKYQENARTSHYYKNVGIVLLTIQQASMPLMARSARYRVHADVFITTVNVFMMEIFRVTLCIIVLLITECDSSFKIFLQRCKEAIVDDPLETIKVCIPAVIYVIQNNLYYVALSHLEATTFCLVYQMKIFTTALFLRGMLGKRLSVQQWGALLLLAFGVADVQIQYQPSKSVPGVEQIPSLGFAAVLTMCLTSAFAGVYMEKVLKQSTVSVWMQNVRLSLFAIPVSILSMFIKDYDEIAEGGLFRGFDALVWVLTATNSLGGILIAFVIKYADNILKAYAQSTAIVGAAIGSWILFDFVPNFMFTIGAAAVLASVCIYTIYPSRKGSEKIVFLEQVSLISKP